MAKADKAVTPAGSKLPAKNDPWSKAVTETGGYGDENVRNEDIIIPRLKIVQAQTKSKEPEWKDGDIVEVVSKKSYGPAINVVPLLIWNSRVYFNDDFTMRCRAALGVVSTQGEFLTRVCSECEHSQWKDRDKPDCNLVHNLAIIEANDLRDASKNGVIIPPMILTLSGASAKIAKQIMTALRIQTRKENRPIFSLMLELQTQEVQGKKGNFYTYTHKIKSLPPELAPFLTALYKQYKAMNIDTDQAVAEEVQETDGHTDNTV